MTFLDILLYVAFFPMYIARYFVNQLFVFITYSSGQFVPRTIAVMQGLLWVTGLVAWTHYVACVIYIAQAAIEGSLTTQFFMMVLRSIAEVQLVLVAAGVLCSLTFLLFPSNRKKWYAR